MGTHLSYWRRREVLIWGEGSFADIFHFCSIFVLKNFIWYIWLFGTLNFTEARYFYTSTHRCKNCGKSCPYLDVHQSHATFCFVGISMFEIFGLALVYILSLFNAGKSSWTSKITDLSNLKKRFWFSWDSSSECSLRKKLVSFFLFTVTFEQFLCDHKTNLNEVQKAGSWRNSTLKE